MPLGSVRSDRGQGDALRGFGHLGDFHLQLVFAEQVVGQFLRERPVVQGGSQGQRPDSVGRYQEGELADFVTLGQYAVVREYLRGIPYLDIQRVAVLVAYVHFEVSRVVLGLAVLDRAQPIELSPTGIQHLEIDPHLPALRKASRQFVPGTDVGNLDGYRGVLPGRDDCRRLLEGYFRCARKHVARALRAQACRARVARPLPGQDA